MLMEFRLRNFNATVLKVLQGKCYSFANKATRWNVGTHTVCIYFFTVCAIQPMAAAFITQPHNNMG